MVPSPPGAFNLPLERTYSGRDPTGFEPMVLTTGLDWDSPNSLGATLSARILGLMPEEVGKGDRIPNEPTPAIQDGLLPQDRFMRVGLGQISVLGK